jgi:hypothetical protein
MIEQHISVSHKADFEEDIFSVLTAAIERSSDSNSTSFNQSFGTISGRRMTASLSLIVIFLAQVILKNAVSGFAPFRNIPKSLSGLRLSSSILDEPALRIGHGFDIHRLIEGTKLIIGPVPHLFF